MAGKQRIPMETQLAIATEYTSGERTGDLAAKYKLDRKTILVVAARNGCTIRGQHYKSGRPKMKTDHLHSEVGRLRDAGLSQSKIGEQLGISPAVISRVLRKLGRPTKLHLLGEKHGSWKGGRLTTSSGYISVMCSDYTEMQDTQGYALEHRLVMARHLGRALAKHETVHHINGDRQDNRIENLQLRQGKHGAGAVFRCNCCGSYDVESTKLAEPN